MGTKYIKDNIDIGKDKFDEEKKCNNSDVKNFPPKENAKEVVNNVTRFTVNVDPNGNPLLFFHGDKRGFKGMCIKGNVKHKRGIILRIMNQNKVWDEIRLSHSLISVLSNGD